jgi:predicted lipase
LKQFLCSVVLTVALAACAGFRPASEQAVNYYNPNMASKLADFSDLAYEKDEEKLIESLNNQYPSFSLLRKIGEDETRYDAQAFVAYDDELIIVAARGSEVPFISMDWRNNAKFFQYKNEKTDTYCEGLGVHGGFFQSALRIANTNLSEEENIPVYKKIEALQKEGNRKVYFTGHSLGGSITNALAFIAAYETNIEISGIYTYGEPKGGNLTYQICHDRKLRDITFRFINNRDIVARVRGPGEYAHVGNLVYFDRAGNLYDENTYTSFWGMAGDVLLFRFASDHFMSNYKELVNDNLNVNPFKKEPSNGN